MNKIYEKLVDMYAGGELCSELEEELKEAAKDNPVLAEDMKSLAETVEVLKQLPVPEFTEESYQRILMKTYAKGIDIQTSTPTPAYLQYHLPIQG
jgi:hypothetical protein